MNASTLKILVPIGLLVGGVFALTFFSQHVPVEEDKKMEEKTEEAPLRFFSSSRQWNPSREASLQDQFFPGLFEPDELRPQATSFWFENRNPQPVTMQLLGVNCTSCSGGRLAPIPPDAAQQLLQMSAVSLLPQGLLTGVTPGMAGPAAQLLDATRPTPTLAWQAYSFKDTPAAKVIFTVPGATGTDRWAPQWGILELNFKVGPTARKDPLTAVFKTQVQGTEQIGQDKFSIFYEPAKPFEIDPPTIDVGELNESSPPQTHDILIYSATREPQDFPTPTISVRLPVGAGGEPGEFVTVGTAVVLPEKDLIPLAMALYKRDGKRTRVRSAVRVPITVKVRDGNAKLDIGALERIVYITQGTNDPKSVTVTGKMRGPVYLSTAKAIDLQSFRPGEVATATEEVTTERVGVELKIVADQTVPKFMQASIQKKPDRGDRGYYDVKVTIPKDELQGELKDAVVVLESVGPNPQRLRIPVKGRRIR